MARMFRVLGFFTLAIGLMAFAGDLVEMALLFSCRLRFCHFGILEIYRANVHIALLGLYDRNIHGVQLLDRIRNGVAALIHLQHQSDPISVGLLFCCVQIK